jgi:hypothetical protein
MSLRTPLSIGRAAVRSASRLAGPVEDKQAEEPDEAPALQSYRTTVYRRSS